jgi:hypothetical protein
MSPAWRFACALEEKNTLTTFFNRALKLLIKRILSIAQYMTKIGYKVNVWAGITRSFQLHMIYLQAELSHFMMEVFHCINVHVLLSELWGGFD